MTKVRLELYQVRGRDFVLANKRALIVMPTGTGKSLIVVEALKRLKQPAWIVCPKSLLGQWRKNLENTTDVQVFSFSMLQHRIEEISKLPQPEIIVVDEPKPLKSNTIVLEHMLKYKIRAPRRIVLDATPIENDLEELWFLFRWLAPKVFGPYAEFMERYVTRAGRYKNMEELRELVAPYVFRPKVPPPRDRKLLFVPVAPQFSKEAGIEHEQLCSALLRSLEQAAKSKNMSAVNRSRGLISRLRSFLSDPLRGAAGKVQRLVQFIDEHPDRRGIIFVFKRDTAKYLKEQISDKGHTVEVFDGRLSAKQRDELREKFNSGALRFLVATSAGERGMDLPSGNLVVHFDLLWTRASYDQRDRVSRLSSERDPAWIVTFILKDTVDEVLWSIISKKQRLMLAPFAGTGDELKITKYSWQRFLKEREAKNGKVDEETGEGVWFSRGKRAHR